MYRLFSSTAIWYEEGDHLGFVMAFASLLPVLLVVAECVLAFATDDRFMFMHLFIGQLLNEAVNQILKDTLKIARPLNGPPTSHPFNMAQTNTVDYGMPSSHGQFVGFFLGVWGLDGIRIPNGLVSKLPVFLLTWLAWVGGSVICVSRWYLRYHSSDQIIVGFLLGLALGYGWRHTRRLFKIV